MKAKSILFLLFVVILSYGHALAFYPSGRITKDQRIQSAHHSERDLKDYSRPARKTLIARAAHKKPPEKSIGKAATTVYGSLIEVVGSGKHNSDQFELKTGLYIVKVKHNGYRHCSIELLHGNGKFAELISNDIGQIEASKAVRIDRAGYYLLGVSADGDWKVSMEYQKEKTPTQESSATAPNYYGSAVPIEIKLKSGRIMKADSYWKDGDKVTISIYGGTMSFDKNDIAEIVIPDSYHESRIAAPVPTPTPTEQTPALTERQRRINELEEERRKFQELTEERIKKPYKKAGIIE